MALRIPLFPQPIRWLVPGIVARMICYWSLVTSPPTIFPSGFEWQTTIAITGAATSGVYARPDLSLLPQPSIQHAFAYAVLAIGLAYAIVDVESTIVRKMVLVVGLTTSYGLLMEAGQLFRPERTASLIDATSNLLGTTVTLGWYELERRAQFVSVNEFRQGHRTQESGHR